LGNIFVKSGVDFGTNLAPAGAQILEKLKQLVARYDFNVTITSARDGVHSGPQDPHHSGEAFDLRTYDLQPAQKRRLLDDLLAALYRDSRRFYGFLESPGSPNEHIHVQRRAGTTYSVLDFLQDQ
jgi:LmbE family N-acetylglucosaminyl deacetylase